MARTSQVPDPFQVPFQTPEDTGIKGQAVPKLRDTKKKSPAQSIVDSLGMHALTANQVAKTLGVSIGKIRKLMDVESIEAPSYEIPFGNSKIYIYTPEDVDELRAYLIRERTPTRRKT